MLHVIVIHPRPWTDCPGACNENKNRTSFLISNCFKSNRGDTRKSVEETWVSRTHYPHITSVFPICSKWHAIFWRYKDYYMKWSFLTWHWHFEPDNFLCDVGVLLCIVGWFVASLTSYLLNASSNPPPFVTTENIPWHVKCSLGRQNVLSLETLPENIQVFFFSITLWVFFHFMLYM